MRKKYIDCTFTYLYICEGGDIYICIEGNTYLYINIHEIHLSDCDLYVIGGNGEKQNNI